MEVSVPAATEDGNCYVSGTTQKDAKVYINDKQVEEETAVTKTITFSEDGPILRISSIPTTSQLDNITVSGTVTDKNDSRPNVYLDDKQLYVDYDGSFDQNFALSVGANPFTVIASNSFGKTSTVTGVVYRQ